MQLYTIRHIITSFLLISYMPFACTMHYQTPPVYHTDGTNTKLMYAVGALSLTAIGISCYTLYKAAYGYHNVILLQQMTARGVISLNEKQEQMQRQFVIWKSKVDSNLDTIENRINKKESEARINKMWETTHIQNIEKNIEMLGRGLASHKEAIENMNNEQLVVIQYLNNHTKFLFWQQNTINALQRKVNALSHIVKTFCMPGPIVPTHSVYIPQGPYPELTNYQHDFQHEETYLHNFDE